MKKGKRMENFLRIISSRTVLLAGRGFATILIVWGIWLPWVLLDDAGEKINGIRAALYIFQGMDVGYMMEFNFLRGLLSLLFPIVIICLAAATAQKTISSIIFKKQPPLWPNRLLSPSLLFLVISIYLFSVNPYADANRHWSLAGFLFPSFGLLMMLCGIIFLMALEILKQLERPRPAWRGIPDEDKQALYESAERQCAGCRCVLPLHVLTVDHISPRSQGGKDAMSNYQLLCHSCNATKGDRPMEYLMTQLEKRGL